MATGGRRLDQLHPDLGRDAESRARIRASRAGVTQLAECLLPKQNVAGSNPVSRSNPLLLDSRGFAARDVAVLASPSVVGSREQVETGVAAVHRIATLGLALLLAGCGAAREATKGELVPLLTGDLGCYAGGEGGPTAPLLAEPRYGTSVFGKPVMWPTGYTARRAGSEVEVLDTQGKVKATTGRTYHMSQAYAPALIPNDDGTFNGPGPHDAFAVAADCTYHHDFIDCTANPRDRWCQPPEPPTVTPTPPQSAE
jgi:hypothetical protein